MRISLVAVGRYCNDPRAKTLAASLAHVGHEVTVIASGRVLECDLEGVALEFVPIRYPAGPGKLRVLLRKLQPAGMRRRLHHSKLAAAVRASNPQIIYPTSEAAVPVAVAAAHGSEAAIIRDPRWVSVGDLDLVSLAPRHPELSVSAAGPGLPFLTPADDRDAYTPEAGRHKQLRIAMCYRKTDTNPGKYLEAALVRAGVKVDVYTDGIDWASIPADTGAVVFVESPYPALDIQGNNPGIPVLFWVHHGEHHIPTNLRLTERYGAHAVLMAHSWHLAHRFPVPVHRFTFGVATELVDASKPWAERKYAASMVGGQLRRRGGTYARRQQLVDSLEKAFGKKETAFVSDITAQEMAAVYSDAKTVINEGGIRHYPITMRVLESIGSGAVLITDDLAGTEMVVPREHYLVLEDDVVAQVERVLADPSRMEKLTTEALEYALGHHTYDHCVDDLVDVIASIDAGSTATTSIPLSSMAQLIDRDVEVQRLAQFGLPDLAGELLSREVWDGNLRIERLKAGSVEAVAIGPEGTRHLARALQAARRYIYAAGDTDAVASYVLRELPDAICTRHGDLLRVDLNADSYRIMPHERSITT
ncbi:MAG: glycosyltransferase family 1 protein [bacterium]|nr:glycosyltransferase family 1 protein [bacterium]